MEIHEVVDWIGREACIHWYGGRTVGIVVKIEDGWLYVNHGYAVEIKDITLIHASAKPCLEGTGKKEGDRRMNMTVEQLTLQAMIVAFQKHCQEAPGTGHHERPHMQLSLYNFAQDSSILQTSAKCGIADCTWALSIRWHIEDA